MVVIDPAFEGCGQDAGMQIWRIEKMEVKPLDQNLYGTFFSGDSYILLHTKKLKSGKLEWNIHFWLGKDTSQDESGVAAIKSVELDDVLGGSPVQHREVQDHESQLLLSYFKDGVRYLDGGVASGFHHVEDEVIKRLLQVKGRRNVRVYQVPMGADSMNMGDCFILDAGPELFVWVGPNSGRLERLKAIQAANAIRDSIHGGRSSITIIDESSTNGERQHFFEELGSDESGIQEAASGGDDEQLERSNNVEISLHKISDDEGSLQVEQIAEKPLKQEDLDHGNCYLLDGGVGGLFVWVGKEASQKERTGSMVLAEKYLEHRGYPKWRAVSRVLDGGETPLFKQYFASWHSPDDQVGLGRVYTEEQIAESLPEVFNIQSLHREKRRLLEKNLGKAVGFMPDDGSGEIEVFRVENFELSPVDQSTYGHFFGGDSYILKYTYNKDGGTKYIIYFWQGLQSSQDERAASAISAVKMDNDLCGKALQVRIVQGEETEHFLRIFRGRMIIFLGGHASGFKNIHDHDTYDVDGTRMFHIKGTSQVNTRAIQVPETSSSLCSEDVFVVETPNQTYLWIGKMSSEEEQEFGKELVGTVSPGRDAVTLNEGEETDDFWAGIGGQGPYQESRISSKPLLSPRLFKCSSNTGKFRVEEVCNFDQEDLSEDDVMVLDTGDEIFIWIGSGASEDEKAQSLKLAEDYVESDPTERSLDNVVIITTKQGEEPAGFKSIFSSWNPELWSNQKSYEDVKAGILALNN